MNEKVQAITENMVKEGYGKGYLSPAGRLKSTLIKIKNSLSQTRIGIIFNNSNITFTVVKGDTVKNVIYSDVSSGIVDNGVINAVESFAAVISETIKKNKLSKGNVTIGLSGLHAITKTITLPAIPKKLLAEAITHEAERELPISVESVYLSWTVTEQSFTETKVFMVAYNKKVIDSLVKALNLAKIKHFKLELTPLSLTKLAKSSSNAVFNVAEGELDIVITSDGAPDLVRTVPLPREKTISEIFPVIREELERTILYYNPEKYLETIHGFGDFPDSSLDYLSAALNRKITVPIPELKYPDGIALNTIAGSLGLLMPGQKPLNGYAAVSNLNLVPVTFRKPLLPDVLIVSSTVFILALLITGVAEYAIAADMTGSYRDQLSAARQSLEKSKLQQAAEQKSLAAFEGRVSQTKTTLSTLNNSITELTDRRLAIDTDIRIAIKLLPSAIIINNVQHADNLILYGNADSEASVLSYVRALEKDRHFEKILLSIQADGIASVSFRLELRPGN